MQGLSGAEKDFFESLVKNDLDSVRRAGVAAFVEAKTALGRNALFFTSSVDAVDLLLAAGVPYAPDITGVTPAAAALSEKRF
jgi:hypothetical protein